MSVNDDDNFGYIFGYNNIIVQVTVTSDVVLSVSIPSYFVETVFNRRGTACLSSFAHLTFHIKFHSFLFSSIEALRVFFEPKDSRAILR